MKLQGNNDAIERAIKCIDLVHSFETHKIGIIYVAPYQTKEEEILANVEGELHFSFVIAGVLTYFLGSRRYLKFLRGMGDIVRLKEFATEYYVAGLDR